MERCLEETLRLKTVIQLLESEIDLKNKGLTKLRKNDVSQKSEIKKLSILIDYQKHELCKHIVTGRMYLTMTTRLHHQMLVVITAQKFPFL